MNSVNTTLSISIAIFFRKLKRELLLLEIFFSLKRFCISSDESEKVTYSGIQLSDF